MTILNDPHKERSIKRIRELLTQLIEVKKFKKKKIAIYLGLEESQHWYFYKFIKGAPFPKYLETITGIILENLRKLLENPALLDKPDSPQDVIKGYDIATESIYVWIPFNRKLPVTPYNGTKPVLSVNLIDGQMGIVAFRNTSMHNADGEIYVDHIGMATGIEPGTRIAIKRINKMDWEPDRYYLIIDASGQIGIRELLAGENKKTIRYISTGSPEGPHMELKYERIEAIFAIVDGNCIPKPKRNSISPPAA